MKFWPHCHADSSVIGALLKPWKDSRDQLFIRADKLPRWLKIDQPASTHCKTLFQLKPLSFNILNQIEFN
jgi:hypothetical protein